VEYTLAPFARFPLQQNEAVAAYRYLLEVEKIEASNVIIAGESAGGHLSLSCLLALAEAKLPKPLGALLLFPWVNLKNSAPSFRANKNKDVLNKYLLDRCVDLVVGKDRNMNTPAREILDLTKPLSDGRLWSHVLPMHSWINVGSHDIFLDDVRHFVQQVRADGAVVDLEIAYGEPHGWQFTANESSFNHYCSLQPDQDVPPGMMPGSENILKGAFAILRSCGRIEESLA
jgi:acetyl esterase/lipase